MRYEYATRLDYERATDALWMRYECTTDSLRDWTMDALWMRYECATNALGIRYECATSALRIRYEWFKFSNVFQKIGVFHGIRRAVVFRARCYQD